MLPPSKVNKYFPPNCRYPPTILAAIITHKKPRSELHVLIPGICLQNGEFRVSVYSLIYTDWFLCLLIFTDWASSSYTDHKCSFHLYSRRLVYIHKSVLNFEAAFSNALIVSIDNILLLNSYPCSPAIRTTFMSPHSIFCIFFKETYFWWLHSSQLFLVKIWIYISTGKAIILYNFSKVCIITSFSLPKIKNVNVFLCLINSAQCHQYIWGSGSRAQQS